MNYLYAPSMARAYDFLRLNNLGLRSGGVSIRTDYSIIRGERFGSRDTIYILDGFQRIADVQQNVLLSGTDPQIVSVEER